MLPEHYTNGVCVVYLDRYNNIPTLCDSLSNTLRLFIAMVGFWLTMLYLSISFKFLPFHYRLSMFIRHIYTYSSTGWCWVTIVEVLALTEGIYMWKLYILYIYTAAAQFDSTKMLRIKIIFSYFKHVITKKSNVLSESKLAWGNIFWY